jgi:hypothetical protein
MAVPLVDLVDQRRQQRAHAHDAGAGAQALFGDLEYQALRAIHQVARREPIIAEHRGGDLAPGFDQSAHERALAHDLGIAARIGGGGRITRERSEVGEPASVGEPAAPLELLGDRHDVRRPSGRDQFSERLEDQPMVRAVEIFGGNDIGDLVPGRLVDQQCAEY